jgi:hypothetical protein
MGALDAELVQQLAAPAGVIGQAGGPGRRRAAAVPGPEGPDHPEAVQLRPFEQRREPPAEDTGVHQADHLAGPALGVFHAGEGLHPCLPA